MTYKEIIQEAKNKLNTLDNLVDDSVDISDLAQALNVYTFLDYSDRLQRVFVKVHLCTDTWVGESVIFLDGEAVCICKQSARKSDKEYYFISEESINKIYSLLRIEPVQPYIDLNSEIDAYYGVDFSGEILHNHGYIYNNSTCELEKVKINDHYLKGNITSQTVNITYIDRDVTEDIDVHLLKFKYNQSLE